MNRRSFTIVELIMVVVLIAVLAVIAIPLMTGGISDRAILQEGVAGMTAILISEKQYAARNNGNYTNDLGAGGLDIEDSLTGKNYSSTAYAVVLGDINHPVTIKFTPSLSYNGSIGSKFSSSFKLCMNVDGSISSEGSN